MTITKHIYKVNGPCSCGAFQGYTKSQSGQPSKQSKTDCACRGKLELSPAINGTQGATSITESYGFFVPVK